MRIGIDAGGTFTDFIVLHEDGHLESFKIRSNPRDPASVILAGLRQAAGRRRVDIVHGSTVATNALLERKGARTAFVTTAGFEDLIHIGRQNRHELYNFTPAPRTPLVPREHCFGVGERTLYDGTVERKPDGTELARLAGRLREEGIESIAICCLHSYQNADNERELVRALGGIGYLCTSHEVSPEFREYERASTTVVNAYVGPRMNRYLAALESSVGHRLWILQSNGGYLSSAQARRHVVRTVLSGPAGGVIAATHMARRSGFRRILGFDMGGTSTDVSLCDGSPRETREAMVDGFPVRVPMLDIHTVGAGGGSIARVDEGGLLHVGPESAGADPGPACYGAGEQATVTDAHVALGRITGEQFLGGTMRIEEARSQRAVEQIALRMRTDVVRAAAGIIRVANANMERAIRAVSIERGFDPRDFALVAFGGGGGLHACEIAVQMEIRTVIVPRYAEGLSALGMLLADAVRDYSCGALGRGDLEQRFRRLEQQARRELKGARLSRAADLRYEGQSYELTVPWRNRLDAGERFHREHRRVYGYSSPERPVETVTLRVRARGATDKPRFPVFRPVAGAATRRRVFLQDRWRTIAVRAREQLTSGTGPMLVLDYGATTLVPPGWKAEVDRAGNLVITLA
jgi:N-methylhydantoinase A